MEDQVPDLYRLAFMPGQFRCPKCDFQCSIQTINVARGEIGTTEEDRQAPDCPNDGTRMVHVTYKEQLTAYAQRLDDELRRNDLRPPEEMSLQEAGRRVYANNISIEAVFDWMTQDGQQVSLCSDLNEITQVWTCAWIIDGTRYSHQDASMRSAINGVIVKCFADAIQGTTLVDEKD